MVNNKVRLISGNIKSRDHELCACPAIPLSYTEIANSILDFMDGQYYISEGGDIDVSVDWDKCKTTALALSEQAKDEIDDAVTVSDERKLEILPVNGRVLRHELEQLLRTLMHEGYDV